MSRSVESERPAASSDPVVAGRYRLERPLGRGGAAEVFAAHDELTGRCVALKRLLGEKAGAAHDTMAAHFRHEFLVLSQVAHANVIEAYERPVLLAARPPAADSKLLTQVAQCCLERRDDTALTQTVSGEAGGVSDSTGLRYELVWLTDPEDPERTRGLVVVAAQLEKLSAITRNLRRAVAEHLQQLR